MRVLVVEDHDDVREGLCRMYRMEGHEAVGAWDGGEAIELYEREAAAGRTFEIALLDFNLPHFKGDTVAVEMKRSAERHAVEPPRFIALTGSQDSKVLGRLQSAGVFEIVIKAGREFNDFEVLKRRIGIGAAA
jgi:CheY-like chemotaxis protein